MVSSGYRHDAGLFEDDQGLLDLLVPFARDGAALGEPVVLALRDRHVQLVRDALKDVPQITFVPSPYTRPASAVRTLLELFEAHAANARARLRVVGEVVDSPTWLTWQPWARYEAAINRLFASFDVWGICAYDTRSTPAPVIDDVIHTHPHITTRHGTRANSDYQPPETFLAARQNPPADPVERAAAALQLTDPTPAAARHAVAKLAASHTRIPNQQASDLVCAVDEAVTNALLYGRPPVKLRAWATVDRLHATVSDSGPGPGDPFAGLTPANSAGSGGLGLGLWVTHQLCSQVTHTRNEDGFTVHLTVGT